MLCVIMLDVVMLRVIVPNVVKLDIAILSVGVSIKLQYKPYLLALLVNIDLDESS
jgi:hypothetical protein